MSVSSAELKSVMRWLFRINFQRRSCVIGTLFLLGAGGCQQQMSNTPRYEAYEASALFPDGSSARPIPEGTVPRAGVSERETTDFDLGYQTGYESGKPLTELPRLIRERYQLPALMIRGRERFEIYCVPCHAPTGDGNGMVPRRGFPYPPTYHSDRLRSVPIGYLFGVVTVGHGRMPSYRDQIPTDDRWAIVTYVRALQLSRHVPRSRLSEQEIDRLKEAAQ